MHNKLRQPSAYTQILLMSGRFIYSCSTDCVKSCLRSPPSSAM